MADQSQTSWEVSSTTSHTQPDVQCPAQVVRTWEGCEASSTDPVGLLEVKLFRKHTHPTHRLEMSWDAISYKSIA